MPSTIIAAIRYTIAVRGMAPDDRLESGRAEQHAAGGERMDGPREPDVAFGRAGLATGSVLRSASATSAEASGTSGTFRHIGRRYRHGP